MYLLTMSVFVMLFYDRTITELTYQLPFFLGCEFLSSKKTEGTKIPQISDLINTTLEAYNKISFAGIANLYLSRCKIIIFVIFI